MNLEEFKYVFKGKKAHKYIPDNEEISSDEESSDEENYDTENSNEENYSEE